MLYLGKSIAEVLSNSETCLVAETYLKTSFKIRCSLLAEALFLVFADERKETSAMGRKWLC